MSPSQLELDASFGFTDMSVKPHILQVLVSLSDVDTFMMDSAQTISEGFFIHKELGQSVIPPPKQRVLIIALGFWYMVRRSQHQLGDGLQCTLATGFSTLVI